MADRHELQRLEDLLGRVLVLGVAASATLLAAGLALNLMGGSGGPIVRAGLLLLMATPIFRVIVSLVEYLRMGDWFFSATAAAVLLVLLTSVAVAVLS